MAQRKIKENELENKKRKLKKSLFFNPFWKAWKNFFSKN
jgi:hypothetical protein